MRRNSSNIASSQAAEWAEKKKQQLEKAKQLREERKGSQIRSQPQDDFIGQGNQFGGNRIGTANLGQQNPHQFGNQAQNSRAQPQKQNNYQRQENHEQDFGFNNQQQVRQTIGQGIGYAAQKSNLQQLNKHGGPMKAQAMNFNEDIQQQQYDRMTSAQNQRQSQAVSKLGQGVQSRVSNQNNGMGYQQYDNNQGRVVQPQQNNRPPVSSNFQQKPLVSQQQKMQRPPSSNLGVRGQNQMNYYEEESKKINQPNQDLKKRPQSGIPQKRPPSASTNNQGFGYQQQNSYRDEVSKQPVSKPAAKVRGPPAMAFAQPKDMHLNECPSCGRSFNDEAYAKHSKICKKVFQSKRKVFNSQAKRMISNEQKQMLVRQKKQEQVKPDNQRRAQQPLGPAPKWKSQSEQFRQAMRAARGVNPQPNLYQGQGYGQGAGRGGGGQRGYAQPPPQQQYDDRKQCPYCQRKFSEVAADRHIPHCKTKTMDVNKRVGGNARGNSQIGGGKGANRR
ncbi:UNKNOWN [Stylonychia lemnae]|uniref:C2HC/C3H-type domain-containing protein n=1 Tax=Stylonychia lemnae TaxID=5949 RepID=A0A078AQF0_STYLE|nr:UNKNOWN [Stylonychia lemnae]|eukprot:CDW84176.1 UNKNOWN [Stylonychia lemnae]